MKILAYIKKDCFSKELFVASFGESKALVSMSNVRSAVPINGSSDFGFIYPDSLVPFLAIAPEALNIRSKLNQERLIPYKPQVGECQSHASDQAISAALATYSKVVNGRRLFV